MKLLFLLSMLGAVLLLFLTCTAPQGAPLFGTWTWDYPPNPYNEGRIWFGRVLLVKEDWDRDGEYECLDRWSWRWPMASDVLPASIECDLDQDGLYETETDQELSYPGHVVFCVSRGEDGQCAAVFKVDRRTGEGAPLFCVDLGADGQCEAVVDSLPKVRDALGMARVVDGS